MKLEIRMDVNETYSNIGLAKAIIESCLTSKDIHEVSSYLATYGMFNISKKGGE